MSLTALDPARMRKHNARKRVNTIALTLSLGAMAFGLFWLAWILFETIRLGITSGCHRPARAIRLQPLDSGRPLSARRGDRS